MTEWIQKQDPSICCLKDTHFIPRDTYRLKVKGWKDIPFKWKSKEPQSGNPYFRQNRLKIKNIIRDKEGHYIMIKESVQEGDITIVNIYAPNIEAPQYIRQSLRGIRREIDSNTIVVGDLNTPLTPMDRSSKERINKETQTLNETLDQVDLADVIRTFHPNP